MTGTNTLGVSLSGISPVSGNFSGNIKKEAVDIAASGLDFSGLMSKNAGNFSGNVIDITDGTVLPPDKKQDKPNDDFSAMTGTGAGKKQIKDAPGRKSPIDGEDDSTVEKVADTVQKIEKSVMESLDVSEEELTKTLELLGLSIIDLLDPQALTQVVMELSGRVNAADLMTDPSFSELLGQLDDIAASFSGEIGVKKEELPQFSDEFGGILDRLSTENADVIQNTGGMSFDAVDAVTEEPDALVDFKDQTVAQTNVPLPVSDDEKPFDETLVVTEGDVEIAELTDTDVSSQNLMPEDKKNVSDDREVKAAAATVVEKVSVTRDAPVEDSVEEQSGKGNVNREQAFSNRNAENNSNGNEQSFSQDQEKQGTDTRDNTLQTANTDVAAETHPEEIQTATVHPGGTENFNNIMEGMAVDAGQFSYIDADSLIDQLSSLTRNYASGETTLSMQLNPENLGRLNLDVTSDKVGAVSANIRVENESVRDTLNAQMAEVKATLESAGIRVTEVSVTVESHAFEEAYENQRGARTDMGGNFDGNGGTQGEGEEPRSGRRNLNINNLDDIADNMTEEEALAASIMRDNGGTVDYSA